MFFLLEFLLALFSLILLLMHNAVATNLAFYTAHLLFKKESSTNPFRRNHGMENRCLKTLICSASLLTALVMIFKVVVFTLTVRLGPITFKGSPYNEKFRIEYFRL